MAFASVCRVTRLSRRQTSFFHRLIVGSLPQSFAGSAFSTTAVLKETAAANTTGEKIYELRTYYIKPKAFADFMKLTEEHIHLRTAKSKLCGYWTSEIGGLNEATHICEYDSYAHRTETRNALSQDKEWLSSYLKPMLKMLVKQENFVMSAVPWFDVKPPLTTGGVYELRVYDIILGKMDQWAHRLVQGFPDRCNLSEPVGVWTTEIGPIGRAVLLWPYKSLDDRVRIRKEAQQIEEWTEAVRDCLSLETKVFSKILIPTKFSLWK